MERHAPRLGEGASPRHLASDGDRIVMAPSLNRALHQLAHLYGIQTAYYDAVHRRQQASAEALLAVLRALGAPVQSLQDVPTALRERRQTLWQRLLEPVVVAWNGGPASMVVRLPSGMADASLVGHLRLEKGEWQNWEWHGAGLPILDAAEVEGTQYVVKHLPLPGGLPWGYHRFTLEVPTGPVESLIISAPVKGHTPSEGTRVRTWGVFLPLYALHAQQSWGSGDFSDLEALIEWVAGMGGSVVATLPLLATFLDNPFDPSPYAPVSRLLWNEFYLDVTRIPELQRCPSAQALLASASFQEEIRSLRSLPVVDYHHLMTLKRRVLKELCRCCFAEASDRLESLRSFAQARPVVEDYARFRATCERQHASWRLWPQPLQEGNLKEGDYDEQTKRYHLYVQWLAHQQVKSLSEKAREKGLGLYLDFPLGVHPEGYDVWHERTAFAMDASGGAPPDVVFTKGQNWMFPPLHPERLRQQGYDYYIACLQHHLQHAGILRIDHVMGLHRLFWIPNGMEVSQGVYVRYRAEEFYAILSLESHRNKAIVVGEDLGIVPGYVRTAMARHGLHRMYVMQYELLSDFQRALQTVPANVVASINTHDMPPFAAFWQGLDIEDRLELGLLDKASARIEQETRQALRKHLVRLLQHKDWADRSSQESQAVLKSILAFLSTSPACAVLVNLEDLWLESEPQNVPSTREERLNWRHRAHYALEDFSRMPEVVKTLQVVDQLRRQLSCPEAKTTSFRLNAPEATSVALVGDFNDWNPNAQLLRPSKGRIWQGTVRLSPGVYQYKFVVGGSEWREDPLNPNRVPNAYGSFNSICEVI